MALKAHFEGKVGKQPELKTSSGDKSYVIFGVATSRYVGEGKGDEYNGKTSAYKTTWVNVLATGKQAEYVANNFSAGDTVLVDGEIDLDSYEKKGQDGNPTGEVVTSLKCFARDISGPFRKASKEDGGNGQQASQPAQQTRQASAPAPRQQQTTQRQAAPAQRQAAAPRQLAAQPAAQPTTQPAATAIIDDDIPF